LPKSADTSFETLPTDVLKQADEVYNAIPTTQGFVLNAPLSTTLFQADVIDVRKRNDKPVEKLHGKLLQCAKRKQHVKENGRSEMRRPKGVERRRGKRNKPMY
jgi:hypothetical protein